MSSVVVVVVKDVYDLLMTVAMRLHHFLAPDSANLNSLRCNMYSICSPIVTSRAVAGMLFLEQDQRENKNNQICTTCKVYTATEDEWGKKQGDRKSLAAVTLFHSAACHQWNKKNVKKKKEKRKIPKQV